MKCNYCDVDNDTVAKVLYETYPLCDECFSCWYPLPDDYAELMEAINIWASSRT